MVDVHQKQVEFFSNIATKSSKKLWSFKDLANNLITSYKSLFFLLIIPLKEFIWDKIYNSFPEIPAFGEYAIWFIVLKSP